MHRVVLRRVFAKTVGSQRGEGAVEIICMESKMAIGAVDFARPEGAGRIEAQMHLQGAAGKPGTVALEGRTLNNGEAKHLLIEGERPWKIGDDDINVVERKLSHVEDNDAVAGEINAPGAPLRRRRRER